MIKTRSIEYQHDGARFEGTLAYREGFKRGPVVLVCHAWAGRGEFEIGMAKRLAELGYAGFAVDLYGKGRFGTSTDECKALMTPFVEDRAMLRARLLHLVDVARSLPEADAANLAAIGFCFGGLCALDLARAGADLKGVAAFHGLFNPPGLKSGRIAAKILALHGWDDPMVPPQSVVALAKELTEAGADWQIHAYGGTMHAFTNPQANDPAFGTVYNARAADRSWASLAQFLGECFS